MAAPPNGLDVLLEIFGPEGDKIDRDRLVRAIRTAELPEKV
jgi:hypothetical protein